MTGSDKGTDDRKALQNAPITIHLFSSVSAAGNTHKNIHTKLFSWYINKNTYQERDLIPSYKDSLWRHKILSM